MYPQKSIILPLMCIQVLTGIVSALIAVCFLLIVFIGVSSNSGEREFNNGKYESIKAGAAGSEAETAVPPGLEQGFLLPEDVTEVRCKFA